MPATINVTNPDAAKEAIQNILKIPAKDERVARWMKKKGQGWLMQRPDCLITILPGSPLERDLPDWALRVRQENTSDLHLFALSHATDDILKHVGGFLRDLLDYEARSDAPELSAQAGKMLDSLTHYDARDLYEKADEFYEALNSSAPKSMGRSRRHIFAADNEDGSRDDITCMKRDDGRELVWRQVMPRGLKTVAVVLRNCLGGRRYAAAVKSGQSQVWCLTSDVPLTDFSPERDILAAAEIDLRSDRLTEVKMLGNAHARPYVDEIRELCSHLSIDGSDELRKVGDAGVRLSLQHADHNVLASDDDFQVLLSNESFLRVTSPDLRTRTLSAGRVEDGRYFGDDIGEITINPETGQAAVRLLADKISKILTDRLKGQVFVSALKAMIGENDVVGAQIHSENDNAPRSYLAGFYEEKEPLFSLESAAFLDDDRKPSLWSDEIVHTTSNDRLEMAISSRGVVALYDLTSVGVGNKTGLSFGNPTIAAAARAAHAQRPGEEVDTPTWKSLLAQHKSSAPANHPRGYLGDRASGEPKDILSLDSSMDLLALDTFEIPGIVGPTRSYCRLPALGNREPDIHVFRRRSSVLHTDEDGSQLLCANLPDGSRVYAVDAGKTRLSIIGEAYAGQDARVESFKSAKRLPALSHWIAMARDIRQAGFAFEDQKSDGFILTRGADGIPETFKNLGTDETPVIRLDKPKRFVGIIPGADGSLETGRVAWTSTPPSKGVVGIQLLSEDGIQHLQRTLTDRNWRYSHAGWPFSADHVLYDAGWRDEKGLLFEMSNQHIESMETESHYVSRGQDHSSTDDRCFNVYYKGKTRGVVFHVRPITPKDGGTAIEAKISTEGQMAVASWQGGLELAVEVVNELGLRLTDWNKQMMGIEGDEPGSYHVKFPDMMQAFEVCEGFTARRMHATQNWGEDQADYTQGPIFSKNFTRDEDRWNLYKDGQTEPVAAYGMHWSKPKIDILEATSECLQAMAEMTRLIEQRKIMDRPIAPEVAPAPENR